MFPSVFGIEPPLAAVSDEPAFVPICDPEFRPSNLGFPISFGFRPSAFGLFRPVLAFQIPPASGILAGINDVFCLTGTAFGEAALQIVAVMKSNNICENQHRHPLF